MKKLLTAALLLLLTAGGVQVVILEPDVPHTFEVTIPAFSEMTGFLGRMREAAGALDFEVSPQETTEETPEAAPGSEIPYTIYTTG